MTRWSVSRLILTLLVSALLWATLAAACITVGSTGEFGWPRNRDVLRIRLDAVLIASLVGAALAAAGVVYQAILQNALADPYLLGVSSGATLFAYLWQLPAFTVGLAIGEQGFAFAGALTAVAIVFLLASRRGRLEPITMLLVGVIVNAVNGSIFLLLNTIIKDPARPGGPLALLVGGLQTNLTISSSEVQLAALVIGLGWLALFAMSGQLNVALLSESEATGLGVRIHRLRWLAMIIASLITASAVAISGPIGFIGLVCPHLARLIVGNDQRRLIPLSTALGAGLLAIADAASRRLSTVSSVETVLPVGVLTGLLGGPFFLLLLWKRKER
ncbi:MAG: iron ABC transporter permease [Anaerolineae bacterium]|nr:iron ABC transporter permease [Phycisphaerae bacterium]